jgi:hypothetical protein
LHQDATCNLSIWTILAPMLAMFLVEIGQVFPQPLSLKGLAGSQQVILFLFITLDSRVE